jgi:stage II sporulation protein D
VKRHVALAAALMTALSCGRPPAPASTTPAVRTPLPGLTDGTTIRVGIVVDRDSALVGATGDFRIEDASGVPVFGGEAGRPWTVRPADEGRVTLTTAAGDARTLAAPVVVVPADASALVTIGGRRYRGEAVVLRGTAGVTVINRVVLEAYLRSVVALELGFRAAGDREAVKAQAVAARTYAARYRGRREALGFDVFPTDADQAYAGVDSELPEVNEAVDATVGEILVYGGRPIQALFHSTCGWSTEAAEQVFQNRESVPYLQAVSDRSGNGPDDYYCRLSPKFRWRESWDADQLMAALTQTLPAVLGARMPPDLGRITAIEATRTTPTGRVAELTVTTTTGTWTVPGGRVREVLRPASGGQLLSTLFQLYPEAQDGRLVRLTAAGAGFGHGVGMCQFGAVGRSRAGQDYRSILATYYQGTTLERAY